MNWIKRTLLIFTAVLLFASAATTSFAAPSPQRDPDPRVIVYGDKMIIWTWYQDRASIPNASDRAALEAAYAEIKRADGNIDSLAQGISAKAAEAGVPMSECSVSDICDITAYKNVDGTWVKDTDTGTVTIKQTSYRFNNFVCLLHRDNGNWEIVDDVKVISNDTIEFTVSSLSPFAVVSWGNSGVGTVNGQSSDAGLGTGTKQAPKTGDNTIKWIAVATAGVLMIAAAAFILLRLGKKRDN